MADVLSRELIDDALNGLQGWSTDGTQLTRDVELDDAQHAQVERAVDEVQTAMNHHADVARQGGTTRFVLSTHSAGGLTPLDVTLASEIDNAVRKATGETAPTPPDESLGTHATPDSRSPDASTESESGEGRSAQRTAALVADVQGTQGQTGAAEDGAVLGRGPGSGGDETPGAEDHEPAQREVWPQRGDEVTTSDAEAKHDEHGRHRANDSEREHERDWEYEQRGGAQGVVSTDEPDRGARDHG